MSKFIFLFEILKIFLDLIFLTKGAKMISITQVVNIFIFHLANIIASLRTFALTHARHETFQNLKRGNNYSLYNHYLACKRCANALLRSCFEILFGKKVQYMKCISFKGVVFVLSFIKSTFGTVASILPTVASFNEKCQVLY